MHVDVLILNSIVTVFHDYGWSVEDLSDISSISQSILNKCLDGSVRPTPTTKSIARKMLSVYRREKLLDPVFATFSLTHPSRPENFDLSRYERSRGEIGKEIAKLIGGRIVIESDKASIVLNNIIDKLKAIGINPSGMYLKDFTKLGYSTILRLRGKVEPTKGVQPRTVKALYEAGVAIGVDVSPVNEWVTALKSTGFWKNL